MTVDVRDSRSSFGNTDKTELTDKVTSKFQSSIDRGFPRLFKGSRDDTGVRAFT